MLLLVSPPPRSKVNDPQLSLTWSYRLARVAAHVGCQGLVAAFPAALITRHRMFSLGLGIGSSRWTRRACQMAADRSLQLLCARRGFSHRERAGTRLGQPAPALLDTHTAVFARCAVAPLEGHEIRIALVEWTSLGWDSHRYGVAYPDGEALA